MIEKESKKKKSLVKELELMEEDDSTLIVETEVESEEFDMLRVEDIEQAARMKDTKRIKGVERVIRVADQPEKTIIGRFENKYYDAGDFDPTFMQMHTSEVSYDLLRKELIDRGIITDLVAEVNSGKEATIYTAHLHEAPLIVKMFRQQNTSHNKQKRRKTGNPQTRAASFALAEFTRMRRAYSAGMNIPTPAQKINNVIIMQFIGQDWIPAPQLRNAHLEQPEEMLDEIIEQMRLMYQKAKLIHGDFSEYNILVHQNKPVIIDFPQAIDMSLIGNISERNIGKNLQVLKKDIQTIKEYFEKAYNLTFDFDEVYSYIAGRHAQREKVDYTIEEIEEMIQLGKLDVPIKKIRDKDLQGIMR